MDPLAFASALIAYCHATGGSVTSWGRTTQHNGAVGGVPTSHHLTFTGADVVYDVPVEGTRATTLAAHLGLKLIRESDHDHFQPL